MSADKFEYRELRQRGIEEFKKIDHNIRLGEMINKTLPSIINFNTKSREEIEKYQLNKLSKLVDYAFENIPLYKKKYSEVGFKSGDIRSFADFERLPILYKDELIDGFPSQIVKNLDDYKYSTRSSGSSGRFVTVAVDLNAIYIDTLQGIRQFLFQSDYRFTPDDVVLFIYTCPWWITDINGKYKLDFLPTTTNPSKALDYIKGIRPTIISTYPTYLQSLREQRIKLSDYGVKCVIVHSEQSNKNFREEMGKILDVSVIDEYSSEELTRIALECKNSNYHLEEDSCYVEVLNPQNKIIRNGTGVVVGTNLLNMATPIIRYYQGDVVTIDSNKECSCGHHGRILTEVHGREMDCIRSNGKLIPASAFMDLAYNWYLTYKIPVHALKYQIVQTSENEIEVLIAKGAFELSQEDLKNIKESFYSLVERSMHISIKFTNDFIQNSNKFKPVINIMGEVK